jgi:hypothetical protein
LKVESDSTSVPPSSIGSATATCPGGSEAVSGGFVGFGPLDAFVLPFTSKRVGDQGWKVSGFNNDFTNPGQLKAFVNRDKHGPGLKQESAKVSVPGRTARSATAKCGGRKSAYSGGFAAQVSGSPPEGAFTFTSKRTQGRGLEGRRRGRDRDRRLTVFAYCK